MIVGTNSSIAILSEAACECRVCVMANEEIAADDNQVVQKPRGMPESILPSPAEVNMHNLAFPMQILVLALCSSTQERKSSCISDEVSSSDATLDRW